MKVNNKSIRSFIALELSPQIQQELAHIQVELQKSSADVKWVKPGGIHLTLKFLGRVSRELLEEVNGVMEQVARKHKRFTLKISHLGAFPAIEYPRVIWVGIAEGNKESQRLAQDLEERLLHLGFMQERRPFRAHLTLGRVRTPRNRQQLKELLLSLKVTPRTMSVEKMVLFQSTLTPEGAIYQPLYQAKLT